MSEREDGQSVLRYESPEGFFRYHLAVGTIVKAVANQKAKKPAYHLTIDFGSDGVRESSAQITTLYTPEDLVGTQVVAVLNFPPRQVASVRSEVLVLGATRSDGAVVLLRPGEMVPNGTPIA